MRIRKIPTPFSGRLARKVFLLKLLVWDVLLLPRGEIRKDCETLYKKVQTKNKSPNPKGFAQQTLGFGLCISLVFTRHNLWDLDFAFLWIFPQRTSAKSSRELLICPKPFLPVKDFCKKYLLRDIARNITFGSRKKFMSRIPPSIVLCHCIRNTIFCITGFPPLS
jgi:hypothetical protein